MAEGEGVGAKMLLHGLGCLSIGRTGNPHEEPSLALTSPLDPHEATPQQPVQPATQPCARHLWDFGADVRDGDADAFREIFRKRHLKRLGTRPSSRPGAPSLHTRRQLAVVHLAHHWHTTVTFAVVTEAMPGFVHTPKN